MKFWFIHSGDVSLHDQIVTQVSLGILSGDLCPDERLPSIRTMAHRYNISPTVVTAAYRQLERQSWVEFRHGSGVHVRERAPREIAGIRPALHLDRLITNLIHAAKSADMSPAELRARIIGQLEAEPPARLLLIESDVELRRIVLTELNESLTLPPGFAITCTDLPRPGDEAGIIAMISQLPGSLVLVLPSKAEALRAVLPPDVAMLILQVRSTSALLSPLLPAPGYSLIGVASRWAPFLSFVKITLLGAGFKPDTLLLRDASQFGWMSGMNQTASVICDCNTAAKLPASIPKIRFKLVAEQSIAELRQMIRTSVSAKKDCETLAAIPLSPASLVSPERPAARTSAA
jgi:DNA-binding transcriptional regulator YhcF (GntR family)